MLRKLHEILLCGAENTLSVSQISVHSQQWGARDLVFLKRSSPHPSLSSSFLSPSLISFPQ